MGSKILCNNEVMKRLLNMETKPVAIVDGDFFNSLHEKGHLPRMVTGRMTYFSLTPPWLRTPVVFVYGDNNNISAPFSNCESPRKNFLREEGKKLIECVIISIWLTK